jgi:hypothetical protein
VLLHTTVHACSTVLKPTRGRLVIAAADISVFLLHLLPLPEDCRSDAKPCVVVVSLVVAMPAEVGSLATVIEDEEAAAAAAVSASSPLSADVSFDGCMGKMEAAFLCRSEERHQQMASRIVAQLAAINRPQWSCAVCRGSDSSGGAQQQASSPSPVVCALCRWPRCLNRLPPPVLCRALLVHVSSHVQLARRLEPAVKAFHRHNSTGQQFRDDVRRAIDLLLDSDAADRARISQLEEQGKGGQHEQQRHSLRADKEDGEERKEPQLMEDSKQEEKEGVAPSTASGAATAACWA